MNSLDLTKNIAVKTVAGLFPATVAIKEITGSGEPAVLPVAPPARLSAPRRLA
jgi:hypothetical protein